MSRTNINRASDAAECLDLFAQLTGEHDLECGVTDLIANLAHLCDQHGIDFLQLVVIAVGHWKLEQTDPEADGIPPYVTITIDGDEHQRTLKTYRVRIAQSVAYDLEVEAPNQEAADIVAEEQFLAMTERERLALFALTRDDVDILSTEEV
ncbi:MAG: hypothetical protein HC869_18690 [Rhodospirillales bacterium]|nr:hypothetical protein [Rhodospirillales bacterium]